MRGKVCPYLYKISPHPKISPIWLKLARLCVREQVLLARWATMAHGGPGSLPADPAFQGDPSEPGLRHVDNAKSSSLAFSSLSSTFLAWSFVSFQKKSISQCETPHPAWLSSMGASDDAVIPPRQFLIFDKKKKSGFLSNWLFAGRRLARILSDRDLLQSCCQNSHLMHLQDQSEKLEMGNFGHNYFLCSNFVFFRKSFHGRCFKCKHAF